MQFMIYRALGVLRRAGIQISRTQPNLVDFLHSRSVDCVLDVGANAGQFGRWLRNHGYRGRIISFEPISFVYEMLAHEAGSDSLWQTEKLAIGSHCGPATINIGSDSTLSSLLSPSRVVLSSNVGAFVGKTETVEVRTLDSIEPTLPPGNFFLKSDTQGFERHVIEGATMVLKRLRGVQLELPIVSLYENPWTLPQAIEDMRASGFVVSQLVSTGFLVRDRPSLREVDVVFRKLDPTMDM
jgi:FkbM family methyltransferase